MYDTRNDKCAWHRLLEEGTAIRQDIEMAHQFGKALARLSKRTRAKSDEFTKFLDQMDESVRS